jgi:hypothetical protein
VSTMGFMHVSCDQLFRPLESHRRMPIAS